MKTDATAAEARGHRLKALREQAGLTQREAAEGIGLPLSSSSRIANYESGKIQRIKRPVVAQLAKLYRTTPDYILYGVRPSASVLPLGQQARGRQVETLLPESALEEMEGHDPARRGQPAPVSELELVSRLADENAKLIKALSECQRQNRTFQQQITLLLGKSAGSRRAPASRAVMA